MSAEQQNFFSKNNRLQQLRGFCYTAQFGSITRAAKHMGLTHSSVSLQIKALSEDLGTKLIARSGPHIELTAEGKRLLNLVQPLVDGIQDLPQIFSEILQLTERTELNIGLNSTSLNFIFPQIAKRYVADHPDCSLVLHYTEHQEAMAKILNEEIDLAILPRRAHMPFPDEYKYVSIFHYTPSLITRSDHPLAGRKKLTVDEILQYDLTLPAKELRVINNLYDVFDPYSTHLKLRVQFKNWETTRKYIEEGFPILELHAQL